MFVNKSTDLFSLDENEGSQANSGSHCQPLPSSNSLDTTAIDGVAHVPRLPNFWTHSPHEWFLHADAVFANQRIRNDTLRVNHVLAALNEEAVKAVSDLIGLNSSYATLKDRLISTFSVPQSTRFRTIIEPGGMGDRRPSQMLRDMRAVLPNTLGDTALREFWLQKLPQNIRAIVSGLDGALADVADRADRVMEASSSRDVFGVQSSITDERFRAMEAAILSLTTQISNLLTAQQSRNNSGYRHNRSRSKSHTQNSQNNPKWCSYHTQYGADARHCKQPCSFKSEN